jgi:hypothetical protein
MAGVLPAGGLRLLVGQGQERIPLRAGETALALFAGKEHHEGAGQQQTKEYGYRDDRHCVEMSA